MLTVKPTNAHAEDAPHVSRPPSPRFIHLKWMTQMNGSERADGAEGHSLNRPRPILAQ